MKYFVFDVETWGLNATPEAFALGVIYGENYLFQTDDLEKLKKELVSKRFDGAIIFAHNALYDLSTVFGNIFTDLDPEAVFNNSTFILAKHNNVTFADSLNILPTSVEKIGEMMEAPKGQTPQKFKKGKPVKLTNNDFKYCINDCRIIFDALTELFQEIGCVRITLASLSMAYFRRKFLRAPIFYNDVIYDFFESYYGGRVECFRLGKVRAQVFDINSMYPHAMKYAVFPNPAKLTRVGETTIKKLLFYMEYYEGMAKVTLNHKPHFYGFLPLKHKEKLLFPNGHFTGSWNFPELRFALKHKIIDIEQVHSVVYAPPMDSIFSEFVDELYGKRLATKNPFEKYLYKIILNSLYGKFAQRKKLKTTYVATLEDVFIKEGAKIIPFSAERGDAYIQEEVPYYSYNTMPVFSSYITSYSRVNLLSKMLKYIDNEVAYCDTDCVAVNNYTADIITSDKLGEFKIEDKIITHIFGNKNYKTLDGELVIKGVRKGATEIGENIFQFQRMIKPKTALRRNMQAGKFITEVKRVSLKYDKRKVFSDGTTAPIFLK